VVSEEKGGGVSNPGIIPMAAGAGVLIVVIIGVFIYFKRKKRR
jgi:LPXTG-motif cell wall-anchored protein